MLKAINGVPWYKRCYRWGQTNLTELDPVRYDSELWRNQWRETRVQGVIVNAGGIVYFYPSKYKEVHRALYLGERDLFGEITTLAHEEGLAVIARMDSNRVHEAFYVEHPDWIAVDANGVPYRAGDLYVTCIHSPYYDQFIPEILREIAHRVMPEGFADNSWTGLDRYHICYCDYCKRGFRDATGHSLPQRVDWDDPVYREWVAWNYKRRLEIWDLNNRTVKEAVGDDCLWAGMISGDIFSSGSRFIDIKAICERAEMILLDNQSRNNMTGFQRNGHTGALINELLGWDKVTIESMSMYMHARRPYRLASKPEPEARMWVLAGLAGNIHPWWHHIGAYHEDRRQYHTAPPLFQWHEQHSDLLTNRRPVAAVGLVYSQQNADYYGREEWETRVQLPEQGLINALVRNRIPYVPIHIDDVEETMGEITTLVLPNIAAMSDEQCERIRRFVEAGGNLLATGETSLYDEFGKPRPDFGLADLLGAHSRKSHHGSQSATTEGWNDWSGHTYLRLLPGTMDGAGGSQREAGPDASTRARHQVLTGFEETDILPFGGRLEVVTPSEGVEVPITFIPSFPVYPPETSWMRIHESTLPGLILRDARGKSGRVAFLPADLDRCYARENIPDHGTLLSNLIRWLVGDNMPLSVSGKGFVHVHLYRQSNKLILHLINLTNPDMWRTFLHELIPIGPLQISVKLSEGKRCQGIRLCVADTEVTQISESSGRVSFEVPRIEDHEMVVVEFS